MTKKIAHMKRKGQRVQRKAKGGRTLMDVRHHDNQRQFIRGTLQERSIERVTSQILRRPDGSV